MARPSGVAPNGNLICGMREIVLRELQHIKFVRARLTNSQIAEAFYVVLEAGAYSAQSLVVSLPCIITERSRIGVVLRRAY